MNGYRTPSRRQLLIGAASVSLALVAGCADRGTEGETGDAGDETNGSDDGTNATDGEPDDGDGASASTDADLDLREANVVDVAFAATDGGYAFDVTLHHDDEGEGGYANWWQVERLDGTRLGRRDLRHAHADQPFTRSATVSIPEGVTCVVVRGHDQTHGYGGVAAAVDLEKGTVNAVDQGSDPRAFDAADCP